MLYFIKDREYYKIGYAKNIKKRFESYNTHNPHFEVVGVREGTLEDEACYHKRIAPFTTKNVGEWVIIPKELIKELTGEFEPYENFKRAAARVMGGSKETSYAPLIDKYQRMIDGEDVEWTKEELRCDNYALIDQYYKTFGKLNKDSSKAQILLSDKDKFTKVKVLAHQKFTQTGRYTADEVKQKLQQVYNQLGITRKAKATDALEIGMRNIRLTSGERVYTYEKK